MSADRFKQAAKANDSGSWNKYSYTRGDPVNRVDHRGTCDELLFDADSGDGGGGNGCDDDGGGGGGSICSSLGLVDAGGGNCVEPQQGTSVNCSATPNAPGCPSQPTCEETETAFVAAYLTKYDSPLAAFAATIVAASDKAGLDDRFIVALAGEETRYATRGLNTQGKNNAFNNGFQSYTTLGDAINGVINLIGSDSRYTSYNSTKDIYSVYERGSVDVPSPGQGTLDQIYGSQLQGNLSNVRNARCP